MMALASVVAGLLAATAAAGPRIAVVPESFDFGTARQSRTLSKEFQVRNFGSDELVIGRITTSCGCTVSHVGEKRIAPGRSTALRVSLDTRKDEGRVVRKVLIESNDPNQPRVTVELTATIVAD